MPLLSIRDYKIGSPQVQAFGDDALDRLYNHDKWSTMLEAGHAEA